MKDLPFTGMAVHRRWAAANLSAAKRVLAATDKSVAWLADPAHRDEAVELLVKVAPFDQGGRRGELRLPPPDRVFRAEQQGVARRNCAIWSRWSSSAGTVAAGFDIERLAMPGLTELVD